MAADIDKMVVPSLHKALPLSLEMELNMFFLLLMDIACFVPARPLLLEMR